MNYMQYYPIDIVNGEGTRCTLFVSGCIHECDGCYNKASWSADHGSPFTREVEDGIIRDLQDTIRPRRGISLSGGDPFYPGNRADILRLCRRVKEECLGKDIWCWTGFTLHELRDPHDPAVDEILQLVDVLIDGKYIKELKDPSLHWRGSSNQIIHVFRL